jgi:hypothetical protein
MTPKRRRDTVAKEFPKMYTFGRSLIDEGDVASLQKNRMIGSVRAPGKETVPKPQENEVVIFRDLLFAGIRFPLHPAVVNILRYFDIYLHNSPPMPSYAFQCICGYAELPRSSRRPKVSLRHIKSIISVVLSSKRKGMRLWCQFGCLNFSYKSGVVSPVTAYRNKWPSDWQQHWMYHIVTPLVAGSRTRWLRGCCLIFTTHIRRICLVPKGMRLL